MVHIAKGWEGPGAESSGMTKRDWNTVCRDCSVCSFPVVLSLTSSSFLTQSHRSAEPLNSSSELHISQTLTRVSPPRDQDFY